MIYLYQKEINHEKNKVKTVLGASVLAAALTAQAQPTPVKSTEIEREIVRNTKNIGNGGGLTPAAKEALIKDLSKKIEAMAKGSKTEIVGQ